MTDSTFAWLWLPVIAAVAGFVPSLLAAQDALPPPNIIFVNAEDMSPHLGCYGHPDANTPAIDALAKTGIVYNNAFATAPICSPARSCLATGLYATSMGTQHLRCEVRIPKEIVPLAVRLRQAGYFCTNTGKSDYNFDPQGIWDAWNNDPAPWRARTGQQPFFAFITVGETHEGRINLEDRYEQATADLPPDARHDADSVHIPPFYPDTPEIRRVFAGMHDLATVFDKKVAALVETLKADGDFANTILFVFSDHGNGLPRYKRWLNDSGLRVPLVVHIPKKYRDYCGASAPQKTDRLVSFVDFPATALSLAGVRPPDLLQGHAFLGPHAASGREYVFAARSRADDMFEVSRSVSDGRFIYVRHFLPHLPYIQNSVIFGDRKASFRELRRLHESGQLHGAAQQLWSERKPTEELYDLRNDPHELTNLAESEAHNSVRDTLRGKLREWILQHRDSGFLPEAEYQRRALQYQITPFEVVQDPELFDLKSTVEAAFQVGRPDTDAAALMRGLDHSEAGVRYWSLVSAINLPEADRQSNVRLLVPNTQKSLNDASPSVQVMAAEYLLRNAAADSKESALALETLGELLEHPQPWGALEAASTAARLQSRVAPLTDIMKDQIKIRLSPPTEKRRYLDFNYSSFTGWALEAALTTCGESDFVDSLPGQ
ncbi:MAG: sulfatase-like hydrolase/transferase [Fuerstiella sp.]